MTELLIIKTANAEKIKALLAEKKVDYQVIYNEIIQEKELAEEKFTKQLTKDYQD
jgi:hypothetical protein